MTINQKLQEKYDREITVTFTFYRIVACLFMVLGLFVLGNVTYWYARYGYELVLAIFALSGICLLVGGIIIDVLCLDNISKRLNGRLNN